MGYTQFKDEQITWDGECKYYIYWRYYKLWSYLGSAFLLKTHGNRMVEIIYARFWRFNGRWATKTPGTKEDNFALGGMSYKYRCAPKYWHLIIFLSFALFCFLVSDSSKNKKQSKMQQEWGCSFQHKNWRLVRVKSLTSKLVASLSLF